MNRHSHGPVCYGVARVFKSFTSHDSRFSPWHLRLVRPRCCTWSSEQAPWRRCRRRARSPQDRANNQDHQHVDGGEDDGRVKGSQTGANSGSCNFYAKRKQTRCGALTRVRSSPSSPSASRCVVVAGLLTCVRVPVPLSVVRLWCRRHTCAAERVSCRTSHPTPSSSLAPCEHRRRCMPCQTARAET